MIRIKAFGWRNKILFPGGMPTFWIDHDTLWTTLFKNLYTIEVKNFSNHFPMALHYIWLFLNRARTTMVMYFIIFFFLKSILNFQVELSYDLLSWKEATSMYTIIKFPGIQNNGECKLWSSSSMFSFTKAACALGYYVLGLQPYVVHRQSDGSLRVDVNKYFSF